ncbi:MAG: hypothetical protein C0469_13460 [Cyanobacteria bacterium DS2.3.42]|nr:hypothetical protein [Cyanobacteria bacterium DS2.3.42]
MTGPQKLSKVSAKEYLALEESALVRHEFVGGRTFAMTGGTHSHNVISLNIATALRDTLKGSGCTVYMTDMKVRVAAADCFYYPDVMVVCKPVEKDSVYTETPTAIFEVLSKSTASVDRREKLFAYQLIPSLLSYVLVHQSRKRVEHYRRIDGEWTLQQFSSDEELMLDCNANTQLPLKVSMDEIYSDIEFDDGPDLMVQETEEVYAW